MIPHIFYSAFPLIYGPDRLLRKLSQNSDSLMYYPTVRCLENLAISSSCKGVNAKPILPRKTFKRMSTDIYGGLLLSVEGLILVQFPCSCLQSTGLAYLLRILGSVGDATRDAEIKKSLSGMSFFAFCALSGDRVRSTLSMSF